MVARELGQKFRMAGMLEARFIEGFLAMGQVTTAAASPFERQFDSTLDCLDNPGGIFR